MNIRTLSVILAIIMVFGLASMAFAQTGTETPTATATTAATMAATATTATGAGATATGATATPSTLPTTGGTSGAWMLPLIAFTALFLVAGLGLNLARRAR